jgi:phosphatidylserine decarboxylase
MIHREGYLLVGVITFDLLLFPALAYYFLPVAFLPVLLIMGFLWVAIVQFFRNPTRKIPNIQDDLLYAPADGKVVVIEKTNEPEYLQKECIQVSIFMSPINVHVNRIPVSGEITYAKYHPGKYLVAWDPKSSTENERTTIAMKTAKGEILFRQIAGALARRIKYYVQAGDKVNQGQEFGFIKFGSRVDLYLPLNATILVQPDQKVYGNRTPIARLNG